MLPPEPKKFNWPHDLYSDFVRHSKVVRVLALSRGYSRDEAAARLRRNHGVVASCSRALAEGLTAQQSERRIQRSPGSRHPKHLRRLHDQTVILLLLPTLNRNFNLNLNLGFLTPPLSVYSEYSVVPPPPQRSLRLGVSFWCCCPLGAEVANGKLGIPAIHLTS